MEERPEVSAIEALALRRLIALRWWAVLLGGVGGAVAWWMDVVSAGPVVLWVPLSILVASNVALSRWVGAQVSETVLVGVLVLDAAVLTVALWNTGGASNPFTVLYIVEVAVAALVLRAPWSWVVTAGAGLGYGLLFVLPGSTDGSGHGMPHHGMEHHATAHQATAHQATGYQGMEQSGVVASFETHLYGMLVAFSVAAVAILVVVQWLVRDLRQREHALESAQQAAFRAKRLAAVSAMAAGAAHELGSPLGTLKLISSELIGMVDQPTDRFCKEVRLLDQEVDRCQNILSQMGIEAGQLHGEPPGRIQVSDLVGRAMAGTTDGTRVVPTLPEEGVELRIPVQAMVRALTNLLQNGLDASGSEQEVALQVEVDPDRVRFVVLDSGRGMAPGVLARSREPFFSTKTQHRGMGLGLFVVQSLADHLGGELMLNSSVGKGTRACLGIPR